MMDLSDDSSVLPQPDGSSDSGESGNDPVDGTNKIRPESVNSDADQHEPLPIHPDSSADASADIVDFGREADGAGAPTHDAQPMGAKGDEKAAVINAILMSIKRGESVDFEDYKRRYPAYEKEIDDLRRFAPRQSSSASGKPSQEQPPSDSPAASANNSTKGDAPPATPAGGSEPRKS